MDPAVAASPASAPPAAFEDGLGERRHTLGAGNEPLEVLRLSTELSAVSSFEFALRERASRYGNFRHESFGRVRAVERLDKLASTLVVVSDHVAGTRLSELLAVAEKRGVRLELDAALYLIRQLVAAAAALHESVPDVCHGAIGPERIIITPDGRLVIVEYVLGAALEQLRYSQERYWRELRIALPRTVGLPRFDAVSDVTQVGTVALALLLGRPLGTHEYPTQVADVAGVASARSASGSPEALPATVRMWLLRALQLDPRGSFASPIEARADLDFAIGENDSGEGSPAIKAFLARCAELESAAKAGASGPDPSAGPSASAAAVAHSALPLYVAPSIQAGHSHAPAPPPLASPPASEPPALTARPAATPPAAASALSAPATNPAPSVVSRAVVAPPFPARPAPAIPAAAPLHGQPAAHERSTHKHPEDAHVPQSRQTPRAAEAGASSKLAWPRHWLIGAAVAVIALTMGATLIGRWGAPSAVETTGTLTVGTNPDGVAVIIDGQHRGATPLNVTLPVGDHLLEIVTDTDRRRIPVTITGGGQVSQFLELPKTTPSLGDLQVRTEPSRAKVSVDGHLFGRSPLIVKNLTPGTHTVVLENESGTITQEVAIESGTMAALVVPMQKPQAANQSGWISVGAPVDVQVYENQRLIGSSRSDRIMVAVGRHDLELVNEALGYRSTRTVDVQAGLVSPLKLEWPKGAVALNALPWAEVFVDGDRLGETPIGSVSLPIGTHEIVFRHPELGERRSTVTVSVGAPTRVSVDLRAK